MSAAGHHGDEPGRRTVRWFDRLLMLYPRPFRAAYGERMRAAFIAELGAARGRRFGMLRLWSKVALDTLVSVPLVRFEGGGRTGASRRRGASSVEAIVRDLRYGMRSLRRAPGFSAAAIVILALGMGATSAVFTLAEALLLRPVPGVAQPERLVRIARVNESTRSGSFPYADYAYFREHADTFSDIAGYRASPMALTASVGDGRYEVQALAVSGNFFDVVGVRIADGRGFLDAEDSTVGTHPVAVLSHAFWRQALAGRDAVGATIRLNGHAFTVVGVAPEGFGGMSAVEEPPDLWVPLHMIPVLAPTSFELFERLENGRIRWVQPLGRLAPGVDRAAAEANLVALAEHLAADFPRTSGGESVALTPDLQYSIPFRSRLLSLARMLALLVGAVLSIAAANIAILLLARGTSRRRELDVRRALGASRARIVVQLLVESLLLAVAGGAAGLLLALWLARVLAALVPFDFWVSLVPDATVLAFAFGVSALAALLFGLVPALRASRPPAATARAGDHGGGLRDLLVIAQVAVSIVLLVAAGLFARSLRAAQAVDLGYDTAGRVAVSVNFSNYGYSTEAARTATRAIFDRLRSVAGAESVSGVELLPFSGDWENCFQVPGVELPEGQDEFCSGFNRVGAGYFALMGHPVLRGREFQLADEAGSGHVVVVNHTAAMQIWGTEDVLGRTILLQDAAGSGNPVPWTVVGVVGDATYSELGAEPQPFVYTDAMQYFLPFLEFVVRARGEPAGLVSAVHEQIHAVDPELTLAGTRSLDEVVAGQLAPYRSATTFVGIFGVLAVALALVGLYAVLAYSVARRRREIGIRVALGATTADITRRILGRGVALVLVGIAIGVTIAWTFADLAAAYLYGVEPHDPPAFLLAPAALLLAALFASVPPALRATRLDPVEELRRD